MPTTGNITVFTESITGDPVANIYITIDSETVERGITNTFGTAYIANVEYGTHTLNFIYAFDDNSGPRQASIPVTVDEAEEEITQTILLPGQPGYSNNAISNYWFLFNPETAIFVISLAADTINFIDYCNCIYGTTGAPVLAECLTDFGVCGGTISVFPIASQPLCKLALQKHTDRLNQCTGNAVALGTSVVFSIAPNLPVQAFSKASSTFKSLSKISNRGCYTI